MGQGVSTPLALEGTLHHVIGSHWWSVWLIMLITSVSLNFKGRFHKLCRMLAR